MFQQNPSRSVRILAACRVFVDLLFRLFLLSQQKAFNNLNTLSPARSNKTLKPPNPSAGQLKICKILPNPVQILPKSCRGFFPPHIPIVRARGCSSVSKRKGSPNNQPGAYLASCVPARCSRSRPSLPKRSAPRAPRRRFMQKDIPAQALLSACRAGDAAAVSRLLPAGGTRFNST